MFAPIHNARLDSALQPVESQEKMKIKRGINPDFGDYDEIDEDAEFAVEEFHMGTISLTELKALIGPEAAQTLAAQVEGHSLTDLFDDPEDF